MVDARGYQWLAFVSSQLADAGLLLLDGHDYCHSLLMLIDVIESNLPNLCKPAVALACPKNNSYLEVFYVFDLASHVECLIFGLVFRGLTSRLPLIISLVQPCIMIISRSWSRLGGLQPLSLTKSFIVLGIDLPYTHQKIEFSKGIYKLPRLAKLLALTLWPDAQRNLKRK